MWSIVAPTEIASTFKPLLLQAEMPGFPKSCADSLHWTRSHSVADVSAPSAPLIRQFPPMHHGIPLLPTKSITYILTAGGQRNPQPSSTGGRPQHVVCTHAPSPRRGVVHHQQYLETKTRLRTV